MHGDLALRRDRSTLLEMTSKNNPRSVSSGDYCEGTLFFKLSAVIGLTIKGCYTMQHTRMHERVGILVT